MQFNMQMFDSKLNFAVNRSVGYESVLMHNHSFVEMVYVECGEGVQKICNTTTKLKQGDVFFIADNSSHSIRPTCEEKDFKIINIIFEKNFIDVDYSLLVPCMVSNFQSDSEIVKNIYNCLSEYESKREYFELRIHGKLYLIISEYLKSLDRSRTKKIAGHKGKAYYVQAAAQYIHEHYHENLTLGQISCHVGLTEGYLQRVFREECKTSVIEYLLRYRIEQACKILVETDLPIQKVSDEIGFSDIKNFHYRFKKLFGVTPKEYRNIYRDKEGGISGLR